MSWDREEIGCKSHWSGFGGSAQTLLRTGQCTTGWHAKLWGLSAFLASVCQAGWVLRNHLKLNIPKTFLRDRDSISSAGLSQAVRLGWGKSCLWCQSRFPKAEALPSSWCAKWGKSFAFIAFVIFLHFSWLKALFCQCLISHTFLAFCDYASENF